MAHNIDMTNDRANVAFLGSRNDIWHRLGQEKQPGASIESWAKDAGLDYTAIMVPAIANLEGPHFDHLPPHLRNRLVNGQKFIVRSDNGVPLGYVSDRYQPVQPIEVLEWFDRYISVDPRFQLDVAGALHGGATIWATATFNGGLDIAGENHVARLLMSTTFDGSGATINQGTMTRTVCANTLRVSHSDKRAVIKTRHNTKFNPERVARELATVAQGFATYKAMGDAMAKIELSKKQVSDFFKECLAIPFDAKEDDVSTKKQNQFSALSNAYGTSIQEGAPDGSVWAALQAVTRYVDHDRSTRGAADVSQDEKLFASSQFGSGDSLKAQAMALLAKYVPEETKPRYGAESVASLLTNGEALLANA